MCLNNRKYPLVLDKETGKKKIIFNCPFEMIDRDSINDYWNFYEECKKACNRCSSNRAMNKMLGGYEFQDVVSVPCGICSECLQDHSRQWAIRIMEESQLHKNNYFVTLTYDDNHLPGTPLTNDDGEIVLDTKGNVKMNPGKYGMLVHDEISKFNKKLKTYLNDKGLRSDFRFYGVGEYGSHTARPHYHVIYFGLDLPDLKFMDKSSHGAMYLESKFLENVWSKGNIVIGDVTMQSAAYVARYCDKKKQLTPLQRKEIINKGIEPEFSVMSRKPGIGANFIGKVVEKVENGEYKLSMNGKEYSLPMYYTKKLEEDLIDEVSLDRMKRVKQRNASMKLYDDIESAEKIGMNLPEYYDMKKEEAKERVKKRI